LPGLPPEPSSGAAVASTGPVHQQLGKIAWQRRTTRKPFLQNWRGTPQGTIELLLEENVLSRINPCAKGCCFQHAALTLMANVIHAMRLKKCSRAIAKSHYTATPETVWQCHSCGCFNEDDEVPECDLCGMAHRPPIDPLDNQSNVADLDSNFGDQSKSGHHSSSSSEAAEIIEIDDVGQVCESD